jgi:HSP20 family protein
MGFDTPQHDLERYLAHFLMHSASKRPHVAFSHHSHLAQAWIPSVDMYETEDAVVVLLDLAGVEPDQTEVHAEPHRLVVRGVRRERPAPAAPRSYHTLEIPYGKFERALRLPSGSDTAAARAHYRDGLLQITIPKRQPRTVRIALTGEAMPDRAGDAR